MKPHRITVLFQGMSFTVLWVHLAVPIRSPDREKPLKISKYLLSNKYLTIFNSAVIKIFNGKSVLETRICKLISFDFLP